MVHFKFDLKIATAAPHTAPPLHTVGVNDGARPHDPAAFAAPAQTCLFCPLRRLDRGVERPEAPPLGRARCAPASPGRLRCRNMRARRAGLAWPNHANFEPEFNHGARDDERGASLHQKPSGVPKDQDLQEAATTVQLDHGTKTSLAEVGDKFIDLAPLMVA